MSSYATPGVYIKELNLLPPSVAEVSTAIPAFVGYTEKALDRKDNSLTNKPTRISSLLEYETFFGKAQAETGLVVTINKPVGGVESVSVSFSGDTSRHNLYYSLQAYFANSGGPCYIVSVGGYKEIGKAMALDELQAGLAALEQEDEPTLIIFPEGQNMSESDYYTLQNASLNLCAKMQDRFAIMDLYATGEDITNGAELGTAVQAFRGGITSSNLNYGAAYFPNLRSVFPYNYTDAGVNVVVVVDDSRSNPAALSTLDSATAAKARAAIAQFGVLLPPSPFIAGIYAAVDSSRGVWKAPANVGVTSASALTFKVTDELQKGLNVDTTGKSINAIRAFTGKGIMVWGARTLAGNDNEWRYINVRRLFIMMEESIKKATQFAIFEPNTASTWLKVKAMIESYLYGLWQRGALAGSKPEHAYFVRVGLNVTMTQQDILEGIMRISVGIAAVRPAEFIEISFSHKLQES